MDAARNRSQILAWWRRWPNANIGVALGRKTGIVVLDVDSRHGGLGSLRELECEYGALPVGPTVLTGGGGLHYYFAAPSDLIKSRHGLCPGIDLLADNSYVLAPGSTHLSGKRYLWAFGKAPSKIPLPVLSSWLKQLATEHDPLTPESVPQTIPEGRRHSTLVSLGGSMRRRGMAVQAIEAALIEENQVHCNPPLGDSELRTIIASISKYPAGNLESATERKSLLFRTAAEFSLETPAEIVWRVKPWLADSCITLVTGKIKEAGKTSWVTHLVAAVLEGKTFMGEDTKQTEVVYLSEERPITFAQALHRAKLCGRKDLTLLLSSDTRGWSWPSVVHAAVEECKSRNAGVLVVDTFAQFAALAHGQENSAEDTLEAIKPIQEAAAAGIAVVLVHHERKSGGHVSDAGRGSSALAGAVDTVVSIRRPEGNHHRNVRLIQALSRFTETPSELLIELSETGYCVQGPPGKIATEQIESNFLALIPRNKKSAVNIETLMKKMQKPRPYIQRLLDALLAQGKLQRIGKGKRGSPFRFLAL